MGKKKFHKSNIENTLFGTFDSLVWKLIQRQSPNQFQHLFWAKDQYAKNSEGFVD